MQSKRAHLKLKSNTYNYKLYDHTLQGISELCNVYVDACMHTLYIWRGTVTLLMCRTLRNYCTQHTGRTLHGTVVTCCIRPSGADGDTHNCFSSCTHSFHQEPHLPYRCGCICTGKCCNQSESVHDSHSSWLVGTLPHMHK